MMPVSDAHRQVTAVALAAAAGHGFALDSGNPLLALAGALNCYPPPPIDAMPGKRPCAMRSRRARQSRYALPAFCSWGRRPWRRAERGVGTRHAGKPAPALPCPQMTK
jgi:hypothetical protein